LVADKAEVNFLIAVTAAAGLFGWVRVLRLHTSLASLLHTLTGTVLVAGGAATLNS